MRRSTDRILTTHTGSLPRPDDLLQAIFAKENGEPYDADALEARISSAVAETVSKQIAAGVDIVNDGEVSKPGYSNYVKDRLSGFGGESRGIGRGIRPTDLAEFPQYGSRLFSDRQTAAWKTPACNGKIVYGDRRDVRRDIANLKNAVKGQSCAEMFMSAASPGVIALFLADHHYHRHDTYLGAIADAMKNEYDEIHRAGLILQVDCPDLAMGRHIQFGQLSLREFRSKAEMQIEALNHALRDIPADRVRMHLCWGNYEGPHHHDVPLREIVDIILKARPSALSFEAANPRHEHEWKVWQDVNLPDGKILIPGVLDSTTNFIEHPELVAERIARFTNLVGRENVIAGTDCGFSTFAGTRTVDPEITWAKLKSMADGARIASEALWKPMQQPSRTRTPATRGSQAAKARAKKAAKLKVRRATISKSKARRRKRR